MRRMTDRRIRIFWTAAALCAIGAAFTLAVQAGADELSDLNTLTEQLTNAKKFKLAASEMDKVASNYVFLRAIGDTAFGATLNPADDSLRTQLGIPAGQGLVASNVAAGGPAAQVGIENNDILVRLGEADLGAPERLVEVLRAAGDKAATLRLIRAGKPLEIQIKPVYRVTFGPAAPEPQQYFIGVQIDPPDDVLRAHLTQLPEGQGLVVKEVVPEGPALKAGLKAFDILLECDGKPLGGTDDLVSQVQGSQGKALTLKALRSGKTLNVNVTPELRMDTAQAQLQEQAAVSLLYLNRLVANQADPNADLLTYARLARAVTPQQGVVITAPNPLDQRLDALTAEVAGLRKSLDDLKKSLKSDGTPKK